MPAYTLGATGNNPEPDRSLCNGNTPLRLEPVFTPGVVLSKLAPPVEALTVPNGTG